VAKASDTGCGTLLAVAAIAFFVGRFSVDGKKLPVPSSQEFMSAPAADETFAATPAPVYSPPERIAAPSTYYRNCSAARAAGAAPVRQGDPGYAPHLDRDHDGVGCE
jgi:hypothetical protein